jgi:hypothetical protein
MQMALSIMGRPDLGNTDSHPDDIALACADLYETWAKPEKTAEYLRMRDEIVGPTSRPAHE